MGESAEQIRRHIETLSSFEVEYHEFISALEDYRREGKERWPNEEFERRRRAIQTNSVRADRAIQASGVGGLVFTEPPAIGGGVRSSDLPSQVFDFIEVNPLSGDDGLSFQRALLDRMPSQIAGLEIKLEEAEARERERAKRKLPKMPKIRIRRLGWVNHPWTITIVGTVVGGVILAGVLGAFH
jgi:hypothetical protein